MGLYFTVVVIYADLECLFLECKGLNTVILYDGIDAVDSEDEVSPRAHEVRLVNLSISHLQNLNGGIGPKRLEWLVRFSSNSQAEKDSRSPEAEKSSFPTAAACDWLLDETNFGLAGLHCRFDTNSIDMGELC